METIEQCLDHILKTLIDNNNKIYWISNLGVTDAYNSLFNPLNVSLYEFKELLKLLIDKDYIEVVFKKRENVEVANKYMGQPTYIKLKLKGKFFRLQGGFQGEEEAKKAEKNRIQKQDDQMRLLTLFLAVGSIGVLAIEALRFLFDYFL